MTMIDGTKIKVMNMETVLRAIYVGMWPYWGPLLQDEPYQQLLKLF